MLYYVNFDSKGYCKLISQKLNFLDKHPIFAAVNHGRIFEVKEHLVKGYLQDAQTSKNLPTRNHGITITNLAAMHGNLHMLELLKEYGCEFGIKDYFNAAANGQIEAMLWFIVHNYVTPNQKIADKLTVYLLAAYAGQTEVVAWLLLNKYSRLNEKNYYGNTAFLLAAANGQIKTMEWLLARGANLHDRNNFGTTAYLKAAVNGQIKTMEWLLKLDPTQANEQNYRGSPDYLLAIEYGRLKTAQWIIANNRNKFNVSNNIGHTAFTVAAKHNMEKIMWWLLSKNYIISNKEIAPKFAENIKDLIDHQLKQIKKYDCSDKQYCFLFEFIPFLYNSYKNIGAESKFNVLIGNTVLGRILNLEFGWWYKNYSSIKSIMKHHQLLSKSITPHYNLKMAIAYGHDRKHDLAQVLSKTPKVIFNVVENYISYGLKAG